jgi:hypothetical protein
MKQRAKKIKSAYCSGYYKSVASLSRNKEIMHDASTRNWVFLFVRNLENQVITRGQHYLIVLKLHLFTEINCTQAVSSLTKKNTKFLATTSKPLHSE